MNTDIDFIKDIKKNPRFFFKDYLKIIFDQFIELHGDRVSSDDKTIIGGFAKLDNIPVIVIGQQQSNIIDEKLIYNYGMVKPSGYKKALKLLSLAEKFKLPVITFIDTPGADPSIESEKKGQSIAISESLMKTTNLKTIIISIIIGEGCSGGAISIIGYDKLFMVDNSYFSIINPEGCASILSSKNELASITDRMQITPKKLLKLNLIDKIIKIKILNKNNLKKNVKKLLKNTLNNLKKISINSLLKNRRKRIIKLGF